MNKLKKKRPLSEHEVGDSVSVPSILPDTVEYRITSKRLVQRWEYDIAEVESEGTVSEVPEQELRAFGQPIKHSKKVQDAIEEWKKVKNNL